MSEYQYYEFRTVGRQLSDKAMEEMSDLSSRAEVSRIAASFDYSYGDFPADPIKVLKRHFDALLYMANWGSRQLAFWFPISSVDYDALCRFDYGEEISVTKTDSHVLLNIFFEDEGDSNWIEGEGALDRMVGLYDEVLAGDYRALFLSWLQAACMEEAKDQETRLPVPPVPPGLGELSEAHWMLISFIGMDPDLVAAAAPFSAPIRQVKNEDLARALDSMPDAEQTEILRRMVMGESLAVVAAELRKRLRAAVLSNETSPTPSSPAPASAGTLFARAQWIRADREDKAEKRAEAERLQRFAELDRDQEGLWRRVDELIATKTVKAYDQAIGILKDLRDLALHRQQREAFARRIETIKAGHPKLVGLIWRINEANLL